MLAFFSPVFLFVIAVLSWPAHPLAWLAQGAQPDPVWAFLGWLFEGVIYPGLTQVPEMGYAMPVIVLVLSLLKKYNVIKDGYGGYAQAIANGLVYFGLLIARHYNNESGYVDVFTQAGLILPTLIGLLAWVFGAAGLYQGLKKIGIGYSHSDPG